MSDFEPRWYQRAILENLSSNDEVTPLTSYRHHIIGIDHSKEGSDVSVTREVKPALHIYYDEIE